MAKYSMALAPRERIRRAGGANKDMVGFLIGSTHYALPISQVREIIKPLPLVSVQRAPHPIVGIAEHRDKIIPVVDLRLALQTSPSNQPKVRWIIAEVNGMPIGLIVDSISDVFSAAELQAHDVTILSPEIVGDTASILSGQKNVVIVLNLNKMLSGLVGNI